MSRIIFNLAAKCDRAGRSQNQDNYWVCPDLTKRNAPLEKIVGTDEDVELSDKGALLVVADGMGGMNAGEVASKLVIEGIKKKFSNIPDSILTNEAEISSFIHSAIVESDESIKQYAKEHKDAEGLGSTIVLLWLLNGRAFCGWCGDSRIYRFNPNNELVRLSHDHSYVQSLVDEGKITEEEAFDHPDGNIISKALGDNGNKADPEIRVYDIYSRDVFMLCSDGLCGLLQDSELNEIISRDCTSSKETLNFLWKEGEKAGWSDNATVDVLCVVEGGKPAKGRPDGYPVMAKKPVDKKSQNKPQIVSGGDNAFAKILKPPYIYLLALIALCLLGLALYNVMGAKETDESTNHEYNIETPNNNNASEGSGNTETPQVPAIQGNQNQTGGGNNGRTGGKPDKPGKQNGSQTNSSNGNNNQNANTQSNPSGSGNQNNGGVSPDIIDQINHGNGQNGGNNSQQNNQPTESYPSQGYLNLLNTVNKDYKNASSAYSTVRQQRYRTKSSDHIISHYMGNIDNNLRSLLNDSKNYDALNNNQKQMIRSFDRLAGEIERNYYNYPMERSNRRQDHNQQNEDDMYGGYGREL